MTIRFSPGPCGCCKPQFAYLLYVMPYRDFGNEIEAKLQVNQLHLVGDLFKLVTSPGAGVINFYTMAWATDMQLCDDNFNGLHVFDPGNSGLPSADIFPVYRNEAGFATEFKDALFGLDPFPIGLKRFELLGWTDYVYVSCYQLEYDSDAQKWKILSGFNGTLVGARFIVSFNGDGSIAGGAAAW